MTEIRFVDTTIRDGNQSLWANNARTEWILPVAGRLDRCGFEAIELSPIDGRKSVRELKEDPWTRIRLVSERVTETPLRTVAGRFRPFDVTPDSMYYLYIERMFANGIRQTRISEEWNQYVGWKRKIEVSKAVGMQPLINLIYSVSPRHTDAYYAERARQALSLDPFRIVLKDPGGLLTPDRMQTIVPAIQANIGGKELELHTHCTTGLGPLVALEAIKLGIAIINTGIPPLADGSGNPSVFNVARNARALGYAPVFNEEEARVVSQHFSAVAQREHMPVGRAKEYDAAQFEHQVPGGMISNLRHQLKLVGMEDKLEDSLIEATRIRAEFGYPVMVTPLSQFVGSQAAINVIVGERYKEVTDQTIHYALGRFGGEEAINAMDQDTRDKILDRRRAQELEDWDPPQPTLEELRAEYGGPGLSDEELLLRFTIGQDEIDVMRASNPRYTGYSLMAEQSIVSLVRQLTERTDRSHIFVQRGDASITLRKSDEVGVRPSHSPREAP